MSNEQNSQEEVYEVVIEDDTDPISEEEEVGTEEQSTDDEEVSTDEDDDAPKFSKKQIQGIVQKRVASAQRKITKLEAHRNIVDKICEVTGLDADTLSARLNAMPLEQQASLLGMTPEQVAVMKASKTQVSTANQELQKLNRQMELTQLKADAKFADIDLFQEDIEELLEDNPKLSMKQAYLLVKGDEALTSVARDAEQAALAKVKAGQKKTVAKGSGVKTGTQIKISKQEAQIAESMGMTIQDYAKYKGIDTIDGHRASKSKK